MPDPTPTPTPEPQKPKIKRGIVNQKYVEALDKASFVTTAVKQKYARTAPQQMKDYFVGEDISSSRARTLQVADSAARESISNNYLTCRRSW